MTRIHTLRRPWFVALAGVLAAGAAAFWLAAPSPAIIIHWKPAPLGLLGMSEGQVLRISVANVVGFDRAGPTGVCTLEVGFVDAENRAYGNPDTFELRPGAARSFDHVAIGDGSVRQYVARSSSIAPQRGLCRGRERRAPRSGSDQRNHRLRRGRVHGSVACEVGVSRVSRFVCANVTS